VSGEFNQTNVYVSNWFRWMRPYTKVGNLYGIG